MVNAKETERILDKFFKECFNFWKRQGNTDRRSFENALKDIKNIKCDPYTPTGDLLNEEIKQKFIRYREIDLGGNYEN